MAVAPVGYWEVMAGGGGGGRRTAATAISG